ncbi:unnamed protein product [Urochloa humidicola]
MAEVNLAGKESALVRKSISILSSGLKEFEMEEIWRCTRSLGQAAAAGSSSGSEVLPAVRARASASSGPRRGWLQEFHLVQVAAS